VFIQEKNFLQTSLSRCKSTGTISLVGEWSGQSCS